MGPDMGYGQVLHCLTVQCRGRLVVDTKQCRDMHQAGYKHNFPAHNRPTKLPWLASVVTIQKRKIGGRDMSTEERCATGLRLWTAGHGPLESHKDAGTGGG